MPRQMVVLLGPGDLAGEGIANRGFSLIFLWNALLTLPWGLPWTVPNWSAVSCLWDGTKFALLAGTWNSEPALDWHLEMPSDTRKPASGQ